MDDKTTTDLAALVARLRALLAQATPPPWEWVGSKRIESTHTEAWRHKSGGEVLVASDDGKPYGLHSATLEAHETDRAFLVAAVNALAALCDAFDALRAERTDLLSALDAIRIKTNATAEENTQQAINRVLYDRDKARTDLRELRVQTWGFVREYVNEVDALRAELARVKAERK